VVSVTNNYIAGMLPNTTYYYSWEPFVSQKSNIGFKTKITLSKKPFINAERIQSSAAGLISFELKLDNVVTSLPEEFYSAGLYPNPAKDKIILKTNEQTISQLNLFSSNGTQMNLDILLSDFEHLEISTIGLPPGIYFLKGVKNNKSFAYKFLKD
jgi:hypothetical protein